MHNQNLLESLIADLKPVKVWRPRTDALLLIVACSAQIVAFWWLDMRRADLRTATGLPTFWWKCLTFAAIGVLGMTTAVRAYRPTQSPRHGTRLLLSFAAASAAAGAALAFFAGDRWSDTARLQWPEGLKCVGEMLLLSVPVSIALALLMRRGAATDPAGAAWASGFAAAGWGVCLFCFACPHDDPFFIIVWYSLGCGAAAAANRLILPMVTRW